MSVPPLRLSNNFDSFISGEVTIHPSAVLAPGVILQAAVNSKIIIGPGVCIGMGSILQVSEGTLEIEAGANLGAGFLMVGQGKIGANACVGSATTVFNCSIEPGVVVPPGSVLGDNSRRIEQTKQLEPSANHAAATTQPEETSSATEQHQVSSSTQITASAFWQFKHQSTSSAVPPSPTSESQPSPVDENTNANSSPPPESTPSQPSTESSNIFGNQIYGQGSVNKLLVTLFPHRQPLKDPISDEQPE